MNIKEARKLFSECRLQKARDRTPVLRKELDKVHELIEDAVRNGEVKAVYQIPESDDHFLLRHIITKDLKEQGYEYNIVNRILIEIWGWVV